MKYLQKTGGSHDMINSNGSSENSEKLSTDLGRSDLNGYLHSKNTY